MDRVLQSFKNLFKCENPFKRHLYYVLLLVLPAIAGSIVSYIDKDTPKTVIITLLIVAAIVGLIAIIPAIFTLGYSLKFIKERLDNVLGFPMFNWDMFKKGLKLFPLYLTWGLYFAILSLVILVVPFALVFTFSISGASPVLGTILVILTVFVELLILMAICIFFAPFVSYVFIGFAKDETYRAEYFNPFTILGYMKKSFKETITVALKFILATFLVNMVSGLLSGSLVVASVLITATAIMFSPDNADKIEYQPLVLILLIFITSISSILQIYGGSLVGFAATENYVEVYKNLIEEQKNSEVQE